MFNDYDCKYKQEIRDLLLGILVRKFSPRGVLRTLTLPGEQFILEKQIFTRFNTYMVTCEKNPKIFKKQKKQDFFTHHQLANINDLAIDQRFHFIWLDYCSILTISLVRDLERIFKFNRTELPQVIAVTIKGGREHAEVIKFLAKAFGISMSKHVNKKIKEDLYPKHLANHLGATNYIVKKYCRGSGGLMYTYIFEK